MKFIFSRRFNFVDLLGISLVVASPLPLWAVVLCGIGVSVVSIIGEELANQL